jgi:hypothetical protein
MDLVERIIQQAVDKSKDKRIDVSDFLNEAANSMRYGGFTPMEVSCTVLCSAWRMRRTRRIIRRGITAANVGPHIRVTQRRERGAASCRRASNGSKRRFFDAGETRLMLTIAIRQTSSGTLPVVGVSARASVSVRVISRLY